MTVLFERQFCTHLVPLARALSVTTGPVLEIGMGYASTPWLSMYCWAAQRRLVSVDNNQEWVDRFTDQPWGERQVVDYDADLQRLVAEYWSVVLVDHWPSRRRQHDAFLFRSSAEILLVHDYAEQQLEWLMAQWPRHEVVSDTLVLTA